MDNNPLPIAVEDENGNIVDPKRLSYQNGQLCLDGVPLTERTPFWVNRVYTYTPPAKKED